METLALIAAALAAGAATGVQDSTSDAVGRLYARVRERLGRRSAELDAAIATQRDMAPSATDPVAPELRRLLEAVQAEQDEELRALAEEVPQQRVGAGGGSVWNIQFSDCKDIKVGDGMHSRSTYYIASAPPVTPGKE
ncbi:hypothetical protein [Streptomyces canus]|uniref:hypothetical protein n=1 Tax=Streptomyces canus TaxID=58343 RepID=UPI00225AC7DC|nr:hypothetical protein [Streptomyces canus]MCX4856592.1 hypothetical protein [Streptomyces canus]